MIYITYIPKLTAYSDRVEQISKLTSIFDKVVIYTNCKEPNTDIKNEDKVKVVYLFENRKRGFRTVISLGKALTIELRGAKDKWLIVDDWFGFLSIYYPILRLSRAAGKRSILLIYSPVTSSSFWFRDNQFSILWRCRDFSFFRLRKIPLELFCYAASDLLSVQSEGLRRRYLRAYPRKSIIVTPNCVTQSLVNEGRETRSPTKIKRVIYAGNWSYNKGMDMILRLAEELRGDPVRIVLAGHGVRREGRRLERRFAHSDIEFISRQPRDDLIRLFQSSDVFILPSRHEGSPRVVLEFLSLDKPVVATDLPGLSDIASPLLLRFEKENYRAFRDQVKKALVLDNLDREVLSRHRKGMAEFTPELTAQTKAVQLKKVMAEQELNV